jgi:VanZ family protein
VTRFRNTKQQCAVHVTQVFTVVYALGLSYLTLAPDPWWIFGSPGRSAEQTFDSTLADYVQHAIVYSMLGVLLAMSSRASNRSLPLPLFFGLCHAVGTECLQYWIPPRSCSAVDGLANLVGLTAGWFLVRGLVSVCCLSPRSNRM